MPIALLAMLSAAAARFSISRFADASRRTPPRLIYLLPPRCRRRVFTLAER